MFNIFSIHVNMLYVNIVLCSLRIIVTHALMFYVLLLIHLFVIVSDCLIY